MVKLAIEYLPIEALKPYKNNTRKHQELDINNIVKSIENYGFDDPIGIWGDENIIVEGHGRLLAAKKLGMTEVPVIRLDHLTDQQRREYAIAHNATAELSQWDQEMLNIELPELDLSGFDFGVSIETIPEEKEIIEDTPPDPPTETTAKRGDIYQLGQHRLMCGDSTSIEDVTALMDGQKANLVLTDPPYNVAIGDKNVYLNAAKGRKHGIEENILGDKNMSDEECGQSLWKPAFSNMLSVAEDKCPIYCFMPQGGTHMMMMMMMKEAGWQVKHELIWVKNVAAFSMGRLDYDYKHEPILYGWNKGHNFYSKFETSIIEDETMDFSKMKKEDLVKLLQEIYSDNRPVSIIREERMQHCNLHPTMKPIKLLAKLLQNSSLAGDAVLDLFGGSGSTLIACEQLGRRCYMCELDPHYVDVIIQRWEKFTGQKAVKINV